MSKNVRMDIIEKLEKFSKENNLKFIWAIEKRPDGCVTVHFQQIDGFKRAIMYRIPNDDILAANGDPDVIAENIIKMVEERM